MENWERVDGWSAYEISNRGNVRRDGRILRWRACGRRHEQYPKVALHQDGIRKDEFVHTLVATHFIGPRPAGHQINHKDRNRFNPDVSNLEYISASANVQHTYATGRRGLIGCVNPAAKLTEVEVVEIRRIYAARQMTQMQLAAQFKVRQATISSIVLRRIWKEVQ